MRGSDERSGPLFSYIDLEARGGADHPLRVIRELANAALADLSGEFSKLYTDFGRPSIAPEKLLRAMLLQAFYGVRSERHLMERMEFDLLFRWFVGLGVDDAFGTIQRSRRIAIGCLKARSSQARPTRPARFSTTPASPSRARTRPLSKIAAARPPSSGPFGPLE